MSLPSWMRRGGWNSRSKFFFFFFFLVVMQGEGSRTEHVLTCRSEKEDIELQLRAVPDIEQRITELMSS